MSGRSLMIVDDSMVFRNRIARLASDPRLGRVHLVAMAENGLEAIAQARQAQSWRIDLQAGDHRRPAQQRACIDVDEQAPDLQLRRGIRRAGCSAEGQLAQRQRQCGRRELHFADPQLAAQQLRTARFELPLQQRRHGQPGRTPEQQHGQHGPRQPSQYTRLQHSTSLH